MDVIHVGEVDYCCMVQFTLVQFIIIQFIMRFKEDTRLACKVVEKNISKLITLNVVSAFDMNLQSFNATYSYRKPQS